MKNDDENVNASCYFEDIRLFSGLLIVSVIYLLNNNLLITGDILAVIYI